jgi:hypothetical protein
MKKYTVAISLFLGGVAGLIAFDLIRSTLDPDGGLIGFWMTPISFILILSGIVSAIIKFFKIEIANRNLGLFVITIAGLMTPFVLYTISSVINLLSMQNIVETGILLSMGFALILPALLFIFIKEFKKNVLWINIVYSIATTGTLLSIFIAGGLWSTAITALVTLVVAIPLAIITSIILLVLRKK